MWILGIPMIVGIVI